MVDDQDWGELERRLDSLEEEVAEMRTQFRRLKDQHAHFENVLSSFETTLNQLQRSET